MANLPMASSSFVPLLQWPAIMAGSPDLAWAAATACRIALLVAEMVRQLGSQGSLEQGFLELLEQPFLAQQVFRLLVAGQKLVKMFRLDYHRESPSSGYPRIAPTQYS